MSGPKVIRIVTREELISNCQALLARLDKVIGRWGRECSKRGLTSDEDLAEARARRNKIAAFLEKERFSDLERAARAEIAYLEEDLEARIEREALRQARIRRSARRISATAATLIGSLRESGSDLPPGLIGKLGAIEAGVLTGPEKANVVLNDAFAVLAQRSEEIRELTEKQLDLAAALSDDKPMEALADWLMSAPQAKTTVNERIDGYIARLETEFGPDVSAPFVDRLVRISAEEDPNRRQMMSDTLVLDLSAETTRRRAHRASLAELDALDGELATFENEGVTEARKAIAEALLTGDHTQAERALDIGQRTLERERTALAAAARRAALLTELVRQGYEVREGMETALARGEQVVIQKASNRDYGVEIGGGTRELLQVRAVAFGEKGCSRDAARDQDMETIWCSEFRQISDAIGHRGGQVEIERALMVGQTPMKVVSLEEIPASPRVALAPARAMERKLP